MLASLLKSDGTAVAFGHQCDIPSPNPRCRDIFDPFRRMLVLQLRAEVVRRAVSTSRAFKLG